MSLSTGTRLGPYEIIAAIGAGGMGEVYQARDTNLGRDVAIKVLPEAFATDPDRLARIEREARTLASLDHPHIAKIHGVERSPGIYALVMELVAGRDLSDLLAAGPMPVDDALAIARQIADALEAAHESGIVHRDLKPANVKVRDDGTVKVLDFGLAKAMDATGTMSASVSQSPTLTTPAMTAMGMILGTAAYMSPEQAKGRPADKRSDIWAFGCVLFEMLTGTRAFRGDDVSDTLASVLAREPSLALLPATLPPAIRVLVERCLVKDRKGRLGDMAAVQFLLSEPSGVAGSHVAAPAPAPPRAGTRERLAWGTAAASTLIALVALAAVVWHPAPPDAPELRLQVVTPPAIFPSAFALSPDGRQLVYWAQVSGARSALWLRPLGIESATLLQGSETAGVVGPPFWSPDGRSVGFISNGRLRRIDAAGGSPTSLADASSYFYGGAWTSDNTILFVPSNASPILRVSAAAPGETTPVTTLAPGQVSHRFPRLLPDGRHFVYFASGSPATQGVYVASLDSTDTRRLFAGDFSAVVLPPDRLLTRRDDALVALRFDPKTYALVGDPVQVSASVSSSRTTFADIAVSASAAGTFAYRSAVDELRQLVWQNRAGARLGPPSEPDASLKINRIRLSPNERQATLVRNVGANSDVWIAETEGWGLRQLTSAPGTDDNGTWSPTGDRVAYASSQLKGGGVNDLFVKPSGGGVETMLFQSPENKNVYDWSRDGRILLIRVQNAASGDDIWALPLNGADADKPIPVVVGTGNQANPSFSRDGRWMAYQSNETGRVEVRLQAFPNGQNSAISRGGGSFPRFGKDEHELFYIGPDDDLMVVSIAYRSDGTVEPGTPVSLFKLRPGAGFDVTRDGQRILVNTPVADTPTPPITVVLNWKAQ